MPTPSRVKPTPHELWQVSCRVYYRAYPLKVCTQGTKIRSVGCRRRGLNPQEVVSRSRAPHSVPSRARLPISPRLQRTTLWSTRESNPAVADAKPSTGYQACPHRKLAAAYRTSVRWAVRFSHHQHCLALRSRDQLQFFLCRVGPFRQTPNPHSVVYDRFLLLHPAQGRV